MSREAAWEGVPLHPSPEQETALVSAHTHAGSYGQETINRSLVQLLFVQISGVWHVQVSDAHVR